MTSKLTFPENLRLIKVAEILPPLGNSVTLKLINLKFSGNATFDVLSYIIEIRCFLVL